MERKIELQFRVEKDVPKILENRAQNLSDKKIEEKRNNRGGDLQKIIPERLQI